MAVERERVFSGDRDRWEDDDAGGLHADDQILVDVQQALHRHPDLDASHIAIVVRTGEVTLSGTVDDPRQKLLAEECAMAVEAVAEVRNRIEIAEPELAGGGKGR